jgi:hypothetical protein
MRPSYGNTFRGRRALPSAEIRPDKRSAHASKHALRFLISRQSTLRRQAINHLRQVLAERVEQLFAGHPGLCQHGIDLF